MVLKNYSEEQVSKAKNIKMIICDVDGVLTSGEIIYDNHQNEFKKFNVKDGLIVKHLRKNNIIIGVITGRESEVVKRRCEELKLDFHFHGIKDKRQKYQHVLTRFNVSDSEVCYIGDDLNDLPLIKSCSLGVCPADAPHYVSEHAQLISRKKGGEGVLREAGDLILDAQGNLESTIEEYLT
ncbi:MAG: HAD-IIIA family hydrolase [Bacteroidota bacterium]